MSFELPQLPYAYDALQPFMSRETLEYHHDKHHQAYVTAGNNLLKDSELAKQSLEDIVIHSYQSNQALFNNASQHYNHSLFWQWMKKDGGGVKIPEKLAQAIDKDLGGFDKFRADFIAAGVSQFGSGWAWLAIKNGELSILKTMNGENPLIFGAKPLLGVDVWEHSYYIDYRNARAKYLEAFFDHLINWEFVEQLFAKAQ